MLFEIWIYILLLFEIWIDKWNNGYYWRRLYIEILVEIWIDNYLLFGIGFVFVMGIIWIWEFKLEFELIRWLSLWGI